MTTTQNGENVNHHSIILSWVPPWLGVAGGHLFESLTLQNVATIASIAYCLVGVYVMLRKRNGSQD